MGCNASTDAAGNATNAPADFEKKVQVSKKQMNVGYGEYSSSDYGRNVMYRSPVRGHHGGNVVVERRAVGNTRVVRSRSPRRQVVYDDYNSSSDRGIVVRNRNYGAAPVQHTTHPVAQRDLQVYQNYAEAPVVHVQPPQTQIEVIPTQPKIRMAEQEPIHVQPPMPQVSVAACEHISVKAPRASITVCQDQPRIHMVDQETYQVKAPETKFSVIPQSPINIECERHEIHIRAPKPKVIIDAPSPIYVKAPKPDIVVDPASPVHIEQPVQKCIIREEPEVIERVVREVHSPRQRTVGRVMVADSSSSEREQVVVRRNAGHAHARVIRVRDDSSSERVRHVRRYEGGEESVKTPANKTAKPAFLGMALYNASNF